MPTAAVKRKRFEKLARKRVIVAIARIRLIGNLANRSNYDYTENHCQQIIEALESELCQLKQRFKEARPKPRYTFTFDL